MVFIMHYCKKQPSLATPLSALLALCLSLTCLPLMAQPVQLVQMADYHHDQQLFLDVRAQIELPDKLVEAVQHEIPLHFITQIELTRRDQILIFPYTRTQTQIRYTTELSYSLFYRRYTLHNMRNGNIEHFNSLEQAMTTLGRLNGFHIAELSQLHPGANYTIRLRFRLAYWQLPAPMVTQAFLDQDWRLTSPWFKLPIHSASMDTR